MCCMWFAHDSTLATWAYVLKTVLCVQWRHCKKNKKQKKNNPPKPSNCTFHCPYYNFHYHHHYYQYYIGVIYCYRSSSFVFDVMVTLTRSSLPWVLHTWMLGTNPLQTPRAWFWGTHKWVISAALLAGGVSRTVGTVLVFGPPLHRGIEWRSLCQSSSDGYSIYYRSISEYLWRNDGLYWNWAETYQFRPQAFFLYR